MTRIKIDRSFVSDIAISVQSQSIVRSVVALCEGYGIATTAEGVETEAQLATLRRHGCRELQGFLFGRAQPNVHWRTQAKTLKAG